MLKYFMLGCWVIEVGMYSYCIMGYDFGNGVCGIDEGYFMR